MHSLSFAFGKSVALVVADFPVGADIQQFRPSFRTRLAIAFNKDLPKVQNFGKKIAYTTSCCGKNFVRPVLRLK